MSKVVIVGAGQAGSEAATHLRGQGFDGEITLIGAENVIPYQRPPLSKKYVTGDTVSYTHLTLPTISWV